MPIYALFLYPATVQLFVGDRFSFLYVMYYVHSLLKMKICANGNVYTQKVLLTKFPQDFLLFFEFLNIWEIEAKMSTMSIAYTVMCQMF